MQAVSVPCNTQGSIICILDMFRVGQNRIYTPYMTVYLVITLPEIPYMHRIYMVLANPKYFARGWMQAVSVPCGAHKPEPFAQINCTGATKNEPKAYSCTAAVICVPKNAGSGMQFREKRHQEVNV